MVVVSLHVGREQREMLFGAHEVQMSMLMVGEKHL